MSNKDYLSYNLFQRCCSAFFFFLFLRFQITVCAVWICGCNEH